MNTPILDGIAKEARSPVSDFLAGIDPTGTKTFRYAIEDAEKTKRQSNIRRGLGTAGGLLAGALLIPPTILGLVRGAPKIKHGLGAAFKSFGRGFTSPFRDLSTGFRAKEGLSAVSSGGKINEKQLNALNHILGKNSGMFVETMKFSPEGLKRVHSANPEILHRLSSDASKAIGTGIGTLALGGLINASSSIAQYNAGRTYGQRLSEEERRRMLDGI